jgi:hypothetical protein
MPGYEAARWRARDVACWLRVLKARGTNVPAISLLPDAWRDLLAADTEPLRLVAVCRRAMDAVDRQMAAERIGATFPCAEAMTAAAIEQCGLRLAERHAAFALLGQQFAEIVGALEETDGPDLGRHCDSAM